MDTPLAIALIVGPPALVVALHRTRAWWLPAMGVFAIALFYFADVASILIAADEVGLAAAGATYFGLIGAAFALYGIVLWIVGSRLRRWHRARTRERIPAATVVAAVTRR